MDDATFQECWAIYLGGPSPACNPFIDRTFRSIRKSDKTLYKIDVFGDVVCKVALHGDAWRTRHDMFKWTLHEQSTWCDYKLGMEPTNLFLPFISQPDTFLELPSHKRQGMIPDLLDVKRRTLMDVKTFHYGSIYRPCRFKAAATCDTVRFRADQVHTQMLNKARKIDRDHNNWSRDSTTQGPVTRALLGYLYDVCEGLAVGAHGECSPDIHNLIERMAKRGAQRRYKDMGFKSPRDAKSTIISQLRLSLGVEAIRGVARVRLQNLGTILAGRKSAQNAAKRRAHAKARFREQTDAYWSRGAYRDSM